MKAVKKDYKQRSHDEDIKRERPYVTSCVYEGKEINLWSYWQGSLDAKILILGQDWGNFNPENRELDASYDIRNHKIKDLSFTNLCLGYRNKGYSGGFKRKWLTDDVKYLIGYNEDGKHIDVCVYDKNMRIFGMAHPGRMGVANRRAHAESRNNDSGLDLQRGDWKKVGITGNI